MGTGTKTATLIDFTANPTVATWVYRLEPPHGAHAEIAVRSKAGSTEIVAWPSGERLTAMVPGYGDPAKALAVWQGYTVAGDETPAALSAPAEATIFSRADEDAKQAEAETEEARPAKRKARKGGEDGERDDDTA